MGFSCSVCKLVNAVNELSKVDLDLNKEDKLSTFGKVDMYRVRWRRFCAQKLRELAVEPENLKRVVQKSRGCSDCAQGRTEFYEATDHGSFCTDAMCMQYLRNHKYNN